MKISYLKIKQFFINLIYTLTLGVLTISCVHNVPRAETTATAQPYQIVAVSASSNDGNLPENVIDNNLATRWSAQGNGQWLTVDLGTEKLIGYVGIAFNSGSQRVFKFDIEVSSDAKAWTAKLLGAKSSGKTDNMEAYDIQDVNARYLRIVGYGNTANNWNSITELQVYPPNPAGLILATLALKSEASPGAKNSVTYTHPGLINPDGSAHEIPPAHPVSGKTINVLDYGADAADNGQDDTLAFAKALAAAVVGDEIYLPAGVYNLKSGFPDAQTGVVMDRTSNINLKTGVNFRGENRETTILRCEFSQADNNALSTSVIRIAGQTDLVISNLTVSSNFSGKYSTDENKNNPERGGPKYGIQITFAGGQIAARVVIDSVIVEKYQRMGVRLSQTTDVAVRRSLFRNATDVGGGGAGYGVSLQGEGHQADRAGFANDSCYNLVEDCQFIGPYIRHGILFQYFTHNNLATRNYLSATRIDSIDCHGEDEYLNEISFNYVEDVANGSGIGVGNSGATHDKSGPGNYLHDNTIINCREAIRIYLGSPDTLVENNIITGFAQRNSIGIYLLYAPGTIVRGNKIFQNPGINFTGILLAFDAGLAENKEETKGAPTHILIAKNEIYKNDYGIKIDAGIDIILEDNLVSDNRKGNIIIVDKSGVIIR